MTTYSANVVSTAKRETDQPLEEEEDGLEWEGMISEGDEKLSMAIEEMRLEEDYCTGQSDGGDFPEDEGWLDEIGNGYLSSSQFKSHQNDIGFKG